DSADSPVATASGNAAGAVVATTPAAAAARIRRLIAAPLPLGRAAAAGTCLGEPSGLVAEQGHHAALRGVIEVVAVRHPLAGVGGIEVAGHLLPGWTITVSLRGPAGPAWKVCPWMCMGG